jgi:hypothetical protein
MKKYVFVIFFALLIITSAVLEGLFELPPRVIQANGLMTILSAAVLIGWTLKSQVDAFRKS